MVRRARRADLIYAVPVVAVDATGLETRRVSAHFGHKLAKGKARKGKGGRKGQRQRAWPKLTTVFHTHSYFRLCAVAGLGPSLDPPEFISAMR